MKSVHNEVPRGSPPIYMAENSLIGADQLALNDKWQHMVKGIAIPRGLIADRVEKMVRFCVWHCSRLVNCAPRQKGAPNNDWER